MESAVITGKFDGAKDCPGFTPGDPVQVWRNGKVPVVYRPGAKQPLLVRLPEIGLEWRDYEEDWLRGNGRSIYFHPKYKAWEVPRSRFDEVIKLSLKRFGSCWIIQEFRERQQCAPACWNAKRFKCECSCLGANHMGRALDHVVSDTFAFEWGERKLSCRLVTRRLQ